MQQRRGGVLPMFVLAGFDATMVWIHGDDIVVGGEAEVVSVECAFKVHMLLKRRALLGRSTRDDQAVTLLRIITSKTARHVEIAIAELGLLGMQKSKPMSTPASDYMEIWDSAKFNPEEPFGSTHMRLSN
eukprot:1017004-Amphidinium_carterae.1